MGGVRKKTTKRGTTFQASKIKKKASETRKKNARAKKQDVTWKSKKTKDPGIPNNFPYKDQVLAELAAQKRAGEEAKEARRLAQKEASAASAALREEVDSDDDNPGIMSVHGRKAVNPPVARVVEELAVVAEAPPPLVDAELPTVQSALDRADAVIQVLDARDPQSFRSAFLENLITETNGKDKLLFVLNKVDLIPRESSTAWLRHLRSSIPAKLRGSIKACLLKSSVKTSDDLSEGMQSKAVPWGRSRLLQILEEWAAEKLKQGGAGEGFTVTVMGLPNVGKSSLINTLLSQPFLPTAIGPTTSQKGNTTTTLTPIEVSLPTDKSGPISVIDTPGWEFNDPEIDFDGEADDEDVSDEEMDGEMVAPQEKWDVLERFVAKDILTRNLGRVDKIKDPYPLARYLISRSNPQDLMLAYNVPAFQQGDVQGFLVNLARSQGRIRKFGVADLDAAAKTILRDWAFSEFPYYTMPPKITGEDLMAVDEDEEVLQFQRTRKEMRSKGKGLIKFDLGPVDERELILDEEYELEAASDSDEEDAMLDESMFLSGDDDEEELEDEEDEDAEEEEEEEEEAEPTPPPAPTKNKRKRHSSPPAPPSKKSKNVIFSANIEKPKSPKKDVPTAGPSSILKRKAREDEAEEVQQQPVREGKKKARRESGGKAVEKVANGTSGAKANGTTEKKPSKSVAKVAPVVKATPAKAAPAVKVAAVAKAAPAVKPRAKAAEKAASDEKPYDFGAHFF